MKVKSIAKCSFCNTLDLHLVIIGLENQFSVSLRMAILQRFYVIQKDMDILMQFHMNIPVILTVMIKSRNLM